MHRLPVVLLLIALLSPLAARAADDPLAKAKALLAAGEFEKVLDAVGEAKAARPTDAAAVLAQAGRLASDKGDRGMASLYCEMALARAPGERKALELCLKVAVLEERWEDAGIWGDSLGKLAPKDGEIALLRARAAIGEMQWARARDLLKPHLKGPLAAQAQPLFDQAERRIAEEHEADKQQREVEARLAKAIQEARAMGRVAPAGGQASGASSEVIIYTTAWCPVCRQGKEWLRHKGISFVEKDIEADQDATEELARKCAEARVRSSGVPVLDARGKLLVGFDARAWAAALR